MNENKIRFCDETMMELISKISKPSLQFYLKRINQQILLDKKHAQMDVNSFISVLIGSLAVLNASALRWILSCLKTKDLSVDIDALVQGLIENINRQLHGEMH